MSDKYLINSSTLTGIASAIRSKTGSSSAFTPAQMVSEIESIPTGGSAVYPNQYESSTITEYTGNESYILDFAFRNCSQLTTVSFSNCEYVGTSAFQLCGNLTTVSFPNCSYIAMYAFTNCSGLTTASFPNCSYVFNYAFQDCNGLTAVYLPKCEVIGNYAFQRCRNLASLYLNQVSSVVHIPDSYVFHNTPLSAGGTGKIYVPSSLYTAFTTATNWSTLSARLVSM